MRSLRIHRNHTFFHLSVASQKRPVNIHSKSTIFGPILLFFSWNVPGTVAYVSTLPLCINANRNVSATTTLIIHNVAKMKFLPHTEIFNTRIHIASFSGQHFLSRARQSACVLNSQLYAMHFMAGFDKISNLTAFHILFWALGKHLIFVDLFCFVLFSVLIFLSFLKKKNLCCLAFGFKRCG